MKRSGGITAAAITLIVLSAFALRGWSLSLLAIIHPVTKRNGITVIRTFVGTDETTMLIILNILLAIGVWGIVTGVGLLRLRRWAWYCILAISALLIADTIRGLFKIEMVTRAASGRPEPYRLIVALCVTYAVSLVLGVWWLTLFLGRDVRAQFASLHRGIAP